MLEVQLNVDDRNLNKKISAESETQIEFLYDRNCADPNFNERVQNFDYQNLNIKISIALHAPDRNLK